ncbi:TNF receptor-associated factor 3 [Desmophyllum pertusum]|uniref:TNF receptor-associated factor 3 n=1 Tax=Desmophyllum pertusum TaxID=174260 RepID=A0A9X0CL49_9CNID|nr:TNF receptor-associated factor 3 [Desmophyllum pertusum]
MVFAIKFVDGRDERLECPICRNVFNEPWQTSCGHRFCANCLEHLFGPESPRCPIDNELISREKSFRDKCCEREVLNLQCFCRYKEKGCEWKGEFRHLKAHEESCQYGDVQCQACGETMERSHLKRHRENDCINRAVACTYCGGEVRQSNMKDHLEVCFKFPISCILNCGKEDIPRDMMEEHVTTQCPKAEHLCPFSVHGCDFKGTAENLDHHIKRSIESHLDMMNFSSHQCNKKNKEMEEKSVIEQKKEIEKLLHDLEGSAAVGANAGVVSSQMEEIMHTLREHEKEVNNLQGELTRLNLAAATPTGHDFRPNSVSASREGERRLDRTEHQLALHEIQLSEQDLQIQMLEATSHDGTYIWKIDHYSRRFQEAASGKTPSIYSPPFYVGRFGYKVCARLYPNGDGMGKGTHMAMFFVIMRGEYDALLPWPFMQKVNFRLIDQDRIRDAYDAFRPEPHSSSFKRPTSDMNVASGCPAFISQAGLREGGYILNDTMFVKITVDMAGLQGQTF